MKAVAYNGILSLIRPSNTVKEDIAKGPAYCETVHVTKEYKRDSVMPPLSDKEIVSTYCF